MGKIKVKTKDESKKGTRRIGWTRDSKTRWDMEEGSSQGKWTQAKLSENQGIHLVCPPHEVENAQARWLGHWQDATSMQSKQLQSKQQASQNDQPSQLFQAFGPVSSPPYWWIIVGSSMASLWLSGNDQAHCCITNTSHVPTHPPVWILCAHHHSMTILPIPCLPCTKPMSYPLQVPTNLPCICKKENMTRKEEEILWEDEKKDTKSILTYQSVWATFGLVSVELTLQKTYLQLWQTAHILSTGICNVGERIKWKVKDLTSKLWQASQSSRGLTGLINLIWSKTKGRWERLHAAVVTTDENKKGIPWLTN